METSTPPSSTSTREPATVDGWPTLTTARAMLRQLDADRERSGYWRSRWADDHSDQAIETWLRSLLDWLESAGPVDAPPAAGPVEARPIGEIRTDLALERSTTDRREWADVAQRLLADVPSLLAEVEAAHRFERSVAVEREALLADVEGLQIALDRARELLSEIVDDDPCWFDHNGDCQAHGWMISTPDGLCGHEQAKRFLRAPLAAAADAPHPDRRPINARFYPDIEEEPLVMVDVDDDPPTCEHGKRGPHRYFVDADPFECPGPSPAVLPQPSEEQR